MLRRRRGEPRWGASGGSNVAGRPLPEPQDDQDRNILGDIERIGWSVIGIENEPGDEAPGDAFSLGIYHTLGHPELIIFGLSHEVAAELINNAGTMVKQTGRPFEP